MYKKLYVSICEKVYGSVWVCVFMSGSVSMCVCVYVGVNENVSIPLNLR